MQYYPIFMDINNQDCLVVGGGELALRKIRLMHTAGANITVIAPIICASLQEDFGNRVTIIHRNFDNKDIGNYRLVIAATSSKVINQQVASTAQERNIPVNVVDQPELCSFITPSVVDRSPIVIAISTSGSAPALAAFLRSKIEAIIPAGFGHLARIMSNYRTAAKNQISNPIDRRRFWQNIIQGQVADYILAGQTSQGEKLLKQTLNRSSKDQQTGSVSLVGAGPGDPDLLTFRALRLMQNADVVLYDRLVSGKILDLCRRDARRINVGKRRSEHTKDQREINQLLVDLARQGNKVVRLKGGDPFIFGRGGEEIELLAKLEIPFQIVPGITAASGCAAYAGIPLTHRDHAQSCLFVTGHLKNGSVDLDWQSLTTANQTVVIYMGLLGLPTVCEKLIEYGVAASMPIALVEQGTTTQQRVFVGTLATLAEQIDNADVHAPTLIIVGTVVTMHQTLSWFDADRINNRD